MTANSKSRSRFLYWFTYAALAVGLGSPIAQGQLSAERVEVHSDNNFDLNPGGVTTVFTLGDHSEHADLVLMRSSHVDQPPGLLFTVYRGEQRVFSPDRSIPIERRMQFLEPLFQRLLQTEKPERAYSLSVYGYSELNDRLSHLAALDKGWNRDRGKPFRQSAGYIYIQHLLEQGAAYREIVDVMSSFHYQVNISNSLEKLWVLPVKKFSPEQRSHISVPVNENDLLPERISVTFRLIKDQ